MRSYNLDPFSASILICLVALAALACFVWAPLMGISWVWNVCVAGTFNFPHIGLWQSALLYVALVCIIYLSGIIQIEVKSETIN
jgi:hypothetical protein